MGLRIPFWSGFDPGFQLFQGSSGITPWSNDQWMCFAWRAIAYSISMSAVAPQSGGSDLMDNWSDSVSWSGTEQDRFKLLANPTSSLLSWGSSAVGSMGNLQLALQAGISQAASIVGDYLTGDYYPGYLMGGFGGGQISNIGGFQIWQINFVPTWDTPLGTVTGDEVGTFTLDLAASGVITNPIYAAIQPDSAPGTENLSSCDITFTANTFLSYATKNGSPVWDTSSGAQINDPFS